MKRLFAITALLTGLWCGTASAQWISRSVNPQSVGKIYIKLTDQASGACWTNLREVREYAEEKLRIAGYSTTVKDDALGYRLTINVMGYRSNNQCVGVVSVVLDKSNISNEVFGFHMVGEYNVVMNENGNMNANIISAVQDVINKM